MRVEEPAVVSVPVLTLQDPLAAVGAVVLDCRPPLLPVSMDISGVDLSAVRFPAVSTAMDGLFPGREQLSTGGGGGGLVGTQLSGAWCDFFILFIFYFIITYLPWVAIYKLYSNMAPS